jgi:hypothetical protein
LISSTNSSGFAIPFEKITLFLERQIAQIVACQTKENPLLFFFDPAAPVKQSNRIEIVGGITITTPSHLKIAFQTPAAKSQNKKR